LDGGQFRVGDSGTHELSWNKNANGKLILKGGFVQNDGGDEDVIGLYRGVYNASYTYYPGDEVTYTADGLTSTYRRMGTGTTRGVAPTNTTYWQVLAKGNVGESAFILDVNDEMINVGVTVAGKAAASRTWNIQLNCFYGSRNVNSGVTFDRSISGNDNGVVSVGSISSAGALAISTTANGTWTKTTVVEITVTAVHSSYGTRSTIIRLFPVFPGADGADGTDGADGVDAEVYELLPGLSELQFSRASDGQTLTPSYRNFTCKVKRTIGANTDVIDPPSGYTIRYSFTGEPDSSASTIGTGGITVYSSLANRYSYLYLALYKDTKLIDKESIPFIKDGAKGADGADGSDGADGADAPYYKYKYQWNGSRTAYPTPFTPSALNAGSDNWKDTQPTKPGTLYYLWRTTGKVSADGNTLVENWSTPIRVTPIESSLKIEVRGTKHNGTTSPAPYVHVYGSDITGSYGRGHNLKVLNASSLSVVWEGYFDTYGDTSNISSLISRINSYQSPAYIIVLYSHDAISINSALNACLHKFGCNHRISLTAQRYAFAFIGRWGLNPGAGITKYSASDEKVDIAATVIEGELITNGSDGINGENLVDNSEAKESYSVSESTSTRKFIQTQMIIPTIPEGKTISCQVRVTLSGCSFPTAGGEVLVYFGSNTSWPTIGYLNGITANGTYDLKTEAVNVNSGDSGWNKYVYIRHYNFYNGGTITIERVKIEEGGVCTEWTPSKNDRRGASTPYQGVYDSSKTYYGNLRRTDVVKYNDVYYVARADAGVFTNKLPTDTDYWNDYGGQFESVATQLLFAEFAYVENLGVRDLQTAQSGKRVHISGDDNAMTIYDEDGYTSAVFSGDQFDDSELFGGADQAVTPTNTNRSYQSGNALHPDMQYTDNQTNDTFNFPYAGVFSGQVVIYGKIYSTLVSSGTAKPSRMLYATVYVYLDNAIIGSARVEDPADIIGGGDTATKTVTVPISQGIAAGNHTLKTKVVISVKNYTSGTLEVTAKSTFSNCKCSADIRMARYFANGQAVGCSASQYMEALLQHVGTAEKLLWKVRAGNCGIRLYDGTLQIMIGGTWYTCSRDSSTGALKLT